jgi:hypothetical protein
VNCFRLRCIQATTTYLPVVEVLYDTGT